MPNERQTTDPYHFHRPARAHNKRDYMGKIMNMIMTHFIRYSFQQKRVGGTQKKEKERERERDQKRTIEEAVDRE